MPADEPSRISLTPFQITFRVLALLLFVLLFIPGANPARISENINRNVWEKGEDIIFLRKIVRGGTDESYGIHVAKLAGVPSNVVSRANKILKSLEKGGVKIKEEKEEKKQVAGQFDLFNMKY